MILKLTGLITVGDINVDDSGDVEFLSDVDQDNIRKSLEMSQQYAESVYDLTIMITDVELTLVSG